MNTHQVTGSSFIASIAYADGVIYVKNHNGTNTAYDGNEDLYNEFINADSAGKFWHARIKALGGRNMS